MSTELSRVQEDEWNEFVDGLKTPQMRAAARHCQKMARRQKDEFCELLLAVMLQYVPEDDEEMSQGFEEFKEAIKTLTR